MFARAHGSTIASAHLFGIPGTRVAATSRTSLGLGAALMTAIYMTRMMLYTFHGPNRTGEKEREHLHEAPWIMTGPLVVLGVLTRVRRLAQPARVFARSSARSGVLEHWLEPVVGERDGARRRRGGRRRRRGLELVLVGVAVADRGSRHRDRVGRGSSRRRSCPRRRRRRKTASSSVLANKYYVDEIYDAAIVEPGRGDVARPALARHRRGLIDGLGVNGSRVSRALRRLGGFAAAVGPARHVCVGAGARRARRARRVQHSADSHKRIHELSADVHRLLSNWVLPGAARHPADRRGGDLDSRRDDRDRGDGDEVGERRRRARRACSR